MAPIGGQPFLHYMFNYLEEQGCTRVILSLGYKHEYITDWLNTQNRSFTIDYVIEQERLGTGGGIQLALKKANKEATVILNGDTMFRVNINKLLEFHHSKRSATTLALKLMNEFDRYGVVHTADDASILSFEEKKYQKEGYINGGVYIINKDWLFKKGLPEKFSFEKEYLEQFVTEKQFYGFCSDAYFIDIGIPSDYRQAEKDFIEFK